MFDSTLLPQTNDPQEIQKAVLDLLDKVNQVQSSNSSTSTDSIQTFTSNSPVPSTQKYIPVNTDNAITLIISNKYALYDEIEVQRISSGLTANAVTLSFTGETIYGATSIALFGNVTAKTVKYTERFVLRKITATTWELVAGEDSGENINGNYINSYNKVSYQHGVKNQSLACTGSAGALFYSPAIGVSLPYTYKTGTIPVNTFYIKNSNGSQFVGASGTNDTLSIVYFMAWRYASATETKDVLWTSLGKWI